MIDLNHYILNESLEKTQEVSKSLNEKKKRGRKVEVQNQNLEVFQVLCGHDLN